MFACPQGLSPRSLIAEYKMGLKAAGAIAPPKINAEPVKESRQYRKVPENRLEARLGLSKYDKPAPLHDTVAVMDTVSIPMSQHIGAPTTPIVEVGDMVKRGDIVGEAGKGLSVNIHASISGKVVAVTKNLVTIKRA